MIRISIPLALVTALVAGCASKPYACPLKDGSTHCRSMQETYEVARRAPRNSTAESVFSAQGHGRGDAPLAPHFNVQAAGETSEIGSPVFRQPKVFRVWLAPYVDADGNLRSGEYTYFSTPGEWNYGTTREAGAAASATFAPQRADSLGFTPVDPVNTRRAAPPKPEVSLPPPAAVTTNGGITQPAQRLTP